MRKHMHGIIAALALFTLACQSFNVQGIDLPGFSPSQPDNVSPQSRFIETQPVNLVQYQGLPPVFVSGRAEPAAYQTQIPMLYYYTPYQMVTPTTIPTRLPEDVIRATVGVPLIVDTAHADRERLESVEIFINDQPVNIEQANSFPAGLADVQICAAYEWVMINQRLIQLCTQAGLIKTNRVPADNFSAKAQQVTLVITPHVAGTFQLSLVANDAQGAVSRLTRKLVVESPTP